MSGRGAFLPAVTVCERVLVVAVVVGGAIRSYLYLLRRSLWLDEAALATNIVQRDFSGLLDPLDGNQGAPVLFLWIQRAMVLVFGNNEYALRLLPLIAGIAAIPLTYLLARRLLSPEAGAVAAVLVALAPALIRYSVEVKQYSSDAAITLVVLLVGLRFVDDPGRRSTLLALGVVGAVAVWASHPSVMILGGVGTVLAVERMAARDWRGVRNLALVGGAWAASAVAIYFVSLRDLGQNEFLVSYWQNGFPPRPFALGSSATWVRSVTLGFLDNPGNLAPTVGAAAALLVAAWLLSRRHLVGLALIVAPLAFLLVAAVAEQYPIRDRMVLFLVPVALVGLASIIDLERWRWAALGVIGLLYLGAVADVVDVVRDPPSIADGRPVFEHVAANQEPGDQVWVHGVTIEPYRYYGPIVGVTADRRTSWRDRSQCADESNEALDLRAAGQGGRVWVVFAYTLSRMPDDEVDILRSRLDAVAERLASFDRTDASATLYHFGSPPPIPVPPADAHTEQLACLLSTDEPPVPSTGLSTGPFGTGRRS